jgi:hypothetical protein
VLWYRKWYFKCSVNIILISIFWMLKLLKVQYILTFVYIMFSLLFFITVIDTTVLFSFMTYHHVCKKRNTTGATSWEGTAYSFKVLIGLVLFYAALCKLLFLFLSFFFARCIVCSSSYIFWFPIGSWYH